MSDADQFYPGVRKPAASGIAFSRLLSPQPAWRRQHLRARALARRRYATDLRGLGKLPLPAPGRLYGRMGRGVEAVRVHLADLCLRSIVTNQPRAGCNDQVKCR